MGVRISPLWGEAVMASICQMGGNLRQIVERQLEQAQYLFSLKIEKIECFPWGKFIFCSDQSMNCNFRIGFSDKHA